MNAFVLITWPNGPTIDASCNHMRRKAQRGLLTNCVTLNLTYKLFNKVAETYRK